MKNKFLKSMLFSALAGAMFLTSCSDDNNATDTTGGGDTSTQDRWITVAGALMQDEAGDGNGGTKVYSVSKTDAKNPDVTIDVYENGFPRSEEHTSELQSRENLV